MWRPASDGMRCIRKGFRGLAFVLLVTLAIGSGAPTARASVTILGIHYKADQAFPEHNCFWNYGQLPGPCSPSSPMGGSVHVYLRNTGLSPVTVHDIVFAGLNLTQVLSLHYQVEKRQPASIWLAGLSSEQLQALVAAGEPVWYKTDPALVETGRVAQVVVRLRQTPQVPNLNVDIVHSDGMTSVVVPVQCGQPVLVGASFSPDLTKAHLYWRRAPGGSGPPQSFSTARTSPAPRQP